VKEVGWLACVSELNCKYTNFMQEQFSCRNISRSYDNWRLAGTWYDYLKCVCWRKIREGLQHSSLWLSNSKSYSKRFVVLYLNNNELYSSKLMKESRSSEHFQSEIWIFNTCILVHKMKFFDSLFRTIENQLSYRFLFFSCKVYSKKGQWNFCWKCET
jgi:hypothetical protein